MKVLKTLWTIIVAIYVAITSFATLYAVFFTAGMSKHYEMNGKDDTEMFNDAQTGIGHLSDNKEENVVKMGFH